MRFPCYALSKGSSSYTFIGAHYFGSDTTVDAITKTTQELAAVRHRWKSSAALEIELFQPSKSLDITGNEISLDLIKKIKEIVNDEQCIRVLPDSNVGAPPQDCLIAVVTFSAEFIVFERVRFPNQLTFVMKGKVEGSPSEITGLVEHGVRDYAEKHPEAEERVIHGIYVYETKNTCDFLEHDLQRSDFAWSSDLRKSVVLLTVPGLKWDAPRGRGCLFVELRTDKYIQLKYELFRKGPAQNYTLVGDGTVKGLPSQSLKVVKDAARNRIERLPDWDTRTMTVRIFVFEPKQGSHYNSQLTTESLRTDFLLRVDLNVFDEVTRSLVVFFETLERQLDATPEEGNVREALAALARKRESPSVGSKYSALLANQREERKDVVYNHRPHLLTGPPVQIYNPAFVTFIREMSHPPTTLEFSDKELDNALDFIDASLDLYESKFNRQSKIDDLRVLGRLISPEITIDARVVTPDGTTTITCPASKQEVTVRIVEVKNEIGEGGSDPIAQAECGFVLICSSKEYEPFRNASCCPMFLVGVAGPHLTVSGAIFTERFVSQRLTDYIYLGSLPTYQEGFPLDHSIRRVAQVLRALSKATNELADYYLKLRFTIPPTLEPYSPRQHGSPRPLSVPVHPIGSRMVPPYFQEYDVDGKKYTVGYDSHLAPSFPAKAVFKGTVMGDGDKAVYNVVIKFTPVYCEDAHRKLADMKRAPFLRFCKRVDNVGMYVVIMDYEDGEHAGTPLEDEDHIEQLRTAVKTLHEANYVHGDLRAPNALITTGGLKLIDFDWCGEEGKARYPADIFLAPDLGWHSGVRRGGLIEKDHDEHMFELMTRSTLRPDTEPRGSSAGENVPEEVLPRVARERSCTSPP